jgi:predicted deacetylase
MARLKLLVSLHDVTPVHAARLARAEALLQSLAIEEVAYLFVPRFHGVPSEEDAAFLSWCRAPRAFRVHWMLHGYLHLEFQSPPAPRAAPAPPAQLAAPAPQAPPAPHASRAQDPSAAPGAWWKRRLLTAGEGEFLTLSGDALHERLEQGRDVFRRCLDANPDSFVPPAWLAHPDLQPALRELGFDFTEDHHRIYQLQHARSQRAPVITWATRTLTRRVGSRVVCPLMSAIWYTQPVLRVALHPHDFDYPATSNNIARVLRRLLRERDAVTYRHTFSAPA